MADKSCEAVVESMAEVKVNGEGSLEASGNGTKKKEKRKKPAKKERDSMKGNSAKVTRTGIEASKAKDFGSWFQEVITKAELIDYYDIRGCYVLRPRSFAIWDAIKDMLDKRIKGLGVENCYFPLFVSSDRLKKEQNHVEGFEAEVAWVTKSGKKELADPIAVRPTSETIMYPAFSKWIRSFRDLPLRINQWSNVVRWEMTHCTPFIRSREFLWQEGHSAFATREEAAGEVLEILDIYKSVYEDLLAVPVIRGTKTESEKFAGALYTTTVEGFVPATGRAIQGATSHCLGQNFAEMFDIKYENDERETKHVWQNSWGMTTRTIGVMIMVHSDDRGLVVPPRVAPQEAVVVPIFKKGHEAIVVEEAEKLGKELKDAGYKVKVDSRTDKTPGWKYNEYELRGICTRLELGPRDIENAKVLCVRRDNGQKIELNRATAVTDLRKILGEIQRSLLERAREELYLNIQRVSNWEEFMSALNSRKIALCPWCQNASCEENVKSRTKNESENSEFNVQAADGEGQSLSGAAKSLCIPFSAELDALGAPPLEKTEKCFACDELAEVLVLFGRSY
uniref:proline--tRNA ligase n=2 Tax=Rhodosorus marinus TaxID=101924 RepID=A0A6T6LRV1_9RHOD|mmetsp:Transcript_18101/g.26178  ORF Transcript_18101/g.26178 Transcript_18101/m.26178 type:complete len:566 (+) Transcript_18101:79-1776(+)